MKVLIIQLSTGFLIGPTILLNTLFHSSMKPFCFLSVTDQVSPPYVQNLCATVSKKGSENLISIKKSHSIPHSNV